MAFAYGYDMALRLNLDRLGWTYIVLAISWTVLLTLGLAFLFINRYLPFLRIRSLPLSISAVATLHVYWCLCMTAYVINGNFPCGTEYWIMSIYLPLGIALYQASNTQLLHIAGVQRRFAVSLAPNRKRIQLANASRKWRQPLVRWESLTATRKATTCIAVGMIAQFICTVTIFLVSRKFHPGWGLTGHGVGKVACRRGWEWWPSIAWQFTWSWLYAPYLLWKLRGVKDIHGWRLQTVLCSLAGLPGSPLWLVALYAPPFSKVNKYFVPPLWFSPCIFVMEASVVFIPCWQILKSRRLKQSTLLIIKEWEKKQKNNNSIGSESTKARSRSMISHDASLNSTSTGRRGEMYTMNALETALQTNSTPLLLFAALKDFSGENISFLNAVIQWKAKWKPLGSRYGLLRKPGSDHLEGEPLLRQQFYSAVEIYYSFVSMRYSDFPINLSSAHQKELESLFEDAAALIGARHSDDTISPFNSSWSSRYTLDVEASVCTDQFSFISQTVNGSAEAILPSPDKKHWSDYKDIKLGQLRDRLPHYLMVPDTFGPTVFNHAEESIKYMVLTNTWPKFVSAGYANSVAKAGRWASVKGTVSSWVETRGEPWTKLTDVFR